MVDIIIDEAHKLCASCNGGVKMVKLPHLESVYQCPVCSGFEYKTEYTQIGDNLIEDEEYSGTGVL